MHINSNTILKTLGVLIVATGLVGVFLSIPSLGDAATADIDASITGPTSASSVNSSTAPATYTGTITWTGTVPPSLLGQNAYVYEFEATGPNGEQLTSGRKDTFSSSSPRSFSHQFDFNKSGTWNVCFNAWLVYNGGNVAKTDCMSVTVNINDGGDDDDDDPLPGNVSVTISANPEVITRGETSRLTWNSTNATRCVASGGWTGEKALDDSQNVSPTVTTTYTITCSNSADTASDAVTVVVREPQPQEEICGDGIDNDKDGRIDEGCTEICGDGKDNDGDGQIDEGCQEICGDGKDNDGDGRIDEGCQEICGDGIDNDKDGQIDEGCQEICGDGKDNDGDGQIDEGCQEICGDGKDNDGDGRIDEGCQEICGDGKDNDGDGRIDEGCQEICGDGKDNDGDGKIDEGCALPSVNISANPQNIFRGDSSTLSWTSLNATSCVASQGWSGSKNLSGSQVVSPNSDTTYKITCSNQNGSAQDSVIVFVQDRPQPTLPTVDITASPQTIERGDTSKLSWVSSNATSCVASQGWSGAKALDGHQNVSPNNDTTYKITCSNSAGSASDSVTVFVTDEPEPPVDNPPTVDIDANPKTIDEGESSILFWNSTNADHCVASGGWSGNVSVDGSRTVSPNNDTTYTITCTNEDGSDTDSVTVFVRDEDDDDDDDDDFESVRVELDANPNTVYAGGQVLLEWDSDNADYCRASGDWSGYVSRDGARLVRPFADSDYRITCYNDDDSDSDEEEVRVIRVQQPPIYVPPIIQPPVYQPPVVKPPVYYPPTAPKPPVVKAPAKSTCDCECGCTGITINNSNAINLVCEDGVCRPVANSEDMGAYRVSDRDDDDDKDSGMFASISGSGITRILGYIFLFFVGLLLLGILVYIVLELLRAISQRRETYLA